MRLYRRISEVLTSICGERLTAAGILGQSAAARAGNAVTLRRRGAERQFRPKSSRSNDFHCPEFAVARYLMQQSPSLPLPHLEADTA